MKGKNRPIECVIYDCDGVLFDSLDANSRLYNHIVSSVGRPPLTETELQYCHTHTVFEAIHHLFHNDVVLEEKARQFLKSVELKDFIVHLHMEPDLLPALAHLKARGISRAICTNRTTSMKHVMERFNLSPYFDMVVTALDVAKPKPDPEAVEKILKTLSLDRGRVLFIGDSEVDLHTARSSRVRFLAYKNRSLPADGFLENHLMVLNFLENGCSPQD